ncbi:gamma-glutamylcyclotransferase family protein [uncultured Subdoligranulum sp.]|uniref:gamma-glutamylcyclotransferase family protein n=1 Tax=uncultured Subdoligranulum sp. TaxID=512298 RepID=UPI0025D925E5|nr:gamma-glutamylcyclotransferase family protein [uncultured Subdoligranulum sp.]
MKELYFAYGSNLNIAQMDNRCPLAQLVSRAVLEGYELAFRCGVLTILPKEGGRVNGLLWRINAWDELTLDRYEGYPHLYTKELLPVQTDSGPQTVVAYVMTAPYCEKVQPPAATYLQTVLDGCRMAGFDPKAVLQAAAQARDVQAQSHKRNHSDAER